MASGEDPCPEHPARTRREKRYCFYVAHHGRGAPEDTQWAEDLSEAEEFQIFDEADWHVLTDSKGHLYGLRLGPDRAVLDLGTSGQKVAKFWKAPENQPWHGFPLWPLAKEGPENRGKLPAPREAIRKMVEAGLLLPNQGKRLQNGERRI